MAEPTFQQLTEQVQRLTQRVAALELELGMRREVVAETPVQVAELQPTPLQPQPAPASDFESKFGLRFVNRIGAITLILGIAFFFRYAVENNWIGETARVLLGAAAGLLLLGAGEFWFRRGERVFAQGVSGAGAAILYLSCYAAFEAYHLIGLPFTFVLLASVTGVAAFLAKRYSAEAMAILALFGGLLAPLVLHDLVGNSWIVPIYIALLDAAFLALAQAEGWRKVEWVALGGTALFVSDMKEAPLRVLLPIFYLMFGTRPNRRLFIAAHIVFLGRVALLPQGSFAFAPELFGFSVAGLAVLRWRGWHQLTGFLVTAAGIAWFLSQKLHGPLPLPIALLVLTLSFLMFLIFSLEWSAKSTSELAALPLNATFFFGACYSRLTGWGNSWAALLALALAALYFVLAYRLRDTRKTVATGIAIAFLSIAIPIELHSFRITIAWALEGAALVWVGARRNAPVAQSFGLAVILGAVLHFFVADLTLPSRLITAIGVGAALFAAAFWSRASFVPAFVPGILGHVVLLTGIAFEVMDRAGKTNAASAIISILFAAYAVVLVAFGTATRTKANRYAGLLLIALVVIKLYLYDVWQLDMVYRFIAFAALGALLLSTSFLYSRYRSRIESWLTLPAASEVHPPPPPE